MAENGRISQKDIDRTYTYFDKQTPEEKRNILDKYFQQRTRSVKSSLEREGLLCLYKEVTKNIGTLKELCDTHSYKLYEGGKDTELEMVKDIYRALNGLAILHEQNIVHRLPHYNIFICINSNLHFIILII
jgi:serine/threonine protein kinase